MATALTTPAWTLPAPTEAVVSLLDGQVLCGVPLILGENLYRGPKRVQAGDDMSRDVPLRAVFVHQNGGGAPMVTHDEASRIESPVTVVVRGSRRDYGEGEDLARAVLRQVHLNVPAGYQDAKSLVAEPQFQGPEGADCYLWLIECIVTRVE